MKNVKYRFVLRNGNATPLSAKQHFKQIDLRQFCKYTILTSIYQQLNDLDILKYLDNQVFEGSCGIFLL